jgi:2-polyprenyl-3-methyl-5-hydroxy-6-metoxy-1,4-benzoquinol methylase
VERFHSREGANDVSIDQAEFALRWLDAIGRSDLAIIDVGCGAGWMTPRLTPYGQVTATDLSDEVLARASERWPEVRFIPGDFMALDFGERCFDVVVTFEVLSHVADQAASVSKVHRLLRPGGLRLLATQSRPALERNRIPPPRPGQLRRWVDRDELSAVLGVLFDTQEMRVLTSRKVNHVLDRSPLVSGE